MTVAELIEFLKTQPQDMMVLMDRGQMRDGLPPYTAGIEEGPTYMKVSFLKNPLRLPAELLPVCRG